jgi:hypothetical protein
MVSPVPAADVRVLGPVTVTGPAGPAGLTGGRQRALVGVLALNAGTVVATSWLVDALQPDDPPRTAVRTLHRPISTKPISTKPIGDGRAGPRGVRWSWTS